jgi:hypothetical protein
MERLKDWLANKQMQRTNRKVSERLRTSVKEESLHSRLRT